MAGPPGPAVHCIRALHTNLQLAGTVHLLPGRTVSTPPPLQQLWNAEGAQGGRGCMRALAPVDLHQIAGAGKPIVAARESWVGVGSILHAPAGWGFSGQSEAPEVGADRRRAAAAHSGCQTSGDASSSERTGGVSRGASSGRHNRGGGQLRQRQREQPPPPPLPGGGPGPGPLAALDRRRPS